MIRLENVTKDYNANGVCTHALKKITMQINHGEMVAITGTSGSGKSTLLNIIGAMDTLTSGKYYFNREDVSLFNARQLHEFRKQYISFVFQNFSLMNKYTVYENVEMPLIARKVKNRKSIVMQKLDLMGIADMKNKLPLQMSGGQQQRCAIARALAADTQVILADEPTGALDSNTSKEIMKCFKSINKESKTIIIITHDSSVADACGRIIRIEDGMICDN